jgi:hypothetical protein
VLLPNCNRPEPGAQLWSLMMPLITRDERRVNALAKSNRGKPCRPGNPRRP